MKYLTLAFALSLGISFLTSCKNEAPTQMDDDGTQYFGEKIDADGSISYDDLLTQLATQDSMEVKVSGKVESVCQSKGCWVNIISTAHPESETMFVKFKDYGFFLPKDCAGQEVIMEGKAYREITTVEELRHYAEDEGKSVEEIEAITEPVEELKFMASGVLLKKS
jgi:hypothetical protein